MKTINEWLNEAAALTGSDYRTAKKLKIHANNIYAWRKDGSISEDNLIILAEMLHVPYDAIAASYHYHRTKSPTAKKAWAKLGKSIAACLVALVSVNYGSADSYANEKNIVSQLDNVSIIRSINNNPNT